MDTSARFLRAQTMPHLNPIEYLGIEAVRIGVPRWHTALAEGRRHAPKCDFILRDGRRCRNTSICEARKLKPPVHRCRLHMPWDVWLRIDHLRRRRGRMLASSANSFLRTKGVALLRQIEIREVLRRWAMNPELRGRLDRAVGRRPEARRPMARRARLQSRPPARDRPADDRMPPRLRPPPDLRFICRDVYQSGWP